MKIEFGRSMIGSLMGLFLVFSAAQSSGQENACSDAFAIRDFEHTIKVCSSLLNNHTNGTVEDRVSAYLTRIVAYSLKGEIDLSMRDIDEIQRLDPEFIDVHQMRGVLWIAKNEPDRAMLHLNEAIRCNPEDATAFAWRSFAHTLKGDPERAIQDSNEALRLSPDDPDAFRGRGKAHYAMRDYQQAVTDLEAALRHAAGIDRPALQTELEQAKAALERTNRSTSDPE